MTQKTLPHGTEQSQKTDLCIIFAIRTRIHWGLSYTQALEYAVTEIGLYRTDKGDNLSEGALLEQQT